MVKLIPLAGMYGKMKLEHGALQIQTISGFSEQFPGNQQRLKKLTGPNQKIVRHINH